MFHWFPEMLMKKAMKQQKANFLLSCSQLQLKLHPAFRLPCKAQSHLLPSSHFCCLCTSNEAHPTEGETNWGTQHLKYKTTKKRDTLTQTFSFMQLTRPTPAPGGRRNSVDASTTFPLGSSLYYANSKTPQKHSP